MNNFTSYLTTRRSSLCSTLQEPGPTNEEIKLIIQIASRVPDHGRLEPWRFEYWSKEIRQKYCNSLNILLEKNNNYDKKILERKIKQNNNLLNSPCLIVVISKINKESYIPEWEQFLSAGASCMNLLHASESLGFGVQWLTAWYCHNKSCNYIFNLKENENICGLMYIGKSEVQKIERERSNVDNILTFI